MPKMMLKNRDKTLKSTSAAQELVFLKNQRTWGSEFFLKVGLVFKSYF